MRKIIPVLLILLGVLSLSLNSCKEDEAKDISFTVTSADLILTVDSLPDSTGSSGTYYVESVNLNLDFFRSACEDKSVYLDDVKSVTISKASLSVPGSSISNLGDVKNAVEEATSSQYANIELASKNPFGAGDSLSVQLGIADPQNLYNYFRLHDFNVKLTMERQLPPDINPMNVTLHLEFNVDATTH